MTISKKARIASATQSVSYDVTSNEPILINNNLT